MLRIPRAGRLDATLAFLREGYGFGRRRFERLQSDIFETRLLGQAAIVLRGAEAARLFYDTERFTRQGAMPGRVLKTLLGECGVQTLEGEAHRLRKAQFLAQLSPPALARLRAAAEAQWRRAAEDWPRRDEFSLLDGVYGLFCRAVCQWAAVPLRDAEAASRCADLVALIESAGAVGPRHWRGRAARRRADRWAAGLVQDTREGRLAPPPDSPLQALAAWRDAQGRPLDPAVAGVELLNLLRPVVAVALFVMYAALELQRRPALAARLAEDAALRRSFAQEVRRHYAFFPQVAARVRQDFEWRGYRFPKGRRVLLDLYATCHDPSLWEAPDSFLAERFLSREPEAWDLIPQGGGEVARHHRCPGEDSALVLLEQALVWLTQHLDYRVPEQDLRLPDRRLPWLPARRLRIRDVRLRHPQQGAA